MNPELVAVILGVIILALIGIVYLDHRALRDELRETRRIATVTEDGALKLAEMDRRPRIRRAAMTDSDVA